MTAFSLNTDQVQRVARWAFDPAADCEDLGGRVEVWEEYDDRYEYVIGADFALGLANRDFDAGVVLNASVSPVRQVAELHGHWGPSFDRVLYAAGRHYGDAFILGERQFGLDRLRSLLSMGYGHLYYDRDEESRSRKITDKLGYWRGTNDVAIPLLRRAVRGGEIVLRSADLIRQMGKLQYAPKTAAIDPEEAQDKHLGIRLSGGGSPDLVMAAAYAWMAVAERHHFEQAKPKFRKGSAGDVLGHGVIYDPKTEDDWRERRRKARTGE